MKETLVNFLNFSGIAWWIKIFTVDPRCTYYFGPFLTSEEAKTSEAGYLEDLEGEGAQGIKVSIQQCQPVELTIYNDELENSGDQVMVNPIFN
ncbi:DUF1816 domain-containing protein [Dapis sp. BLCC M229]|uniref:DUF1816 domain-containing protein n=1 Tax=Dapis sp. BLCC M229 TaxID=3400188 RepID=UPI003CF09504